MQPEKTELALNALREFYDASLEDYATRSFGSVSAAQRSILEAEHCEQLQIAKDRGYESPGEFEPSDTEVSAVRLELGRLATAKGLSEPR